MPKIAIIESKPSRNNYTQLFDNNIEFDLYSLVSDPGIKKVLKKDVDIEIDIDQYGFVILVGSEPLKYFTKITKITDYSGALIDDKFLPVINPAMLKFKPEANKLWEESKRKILGYIKGEITTVDLNSEDFVGIETAEGAKEFLLGVLKAKYPYVACDTETSGLFPRDGYVLGISMSGEPDTGAYISTDCITPEIEELFQEIFNTKRVIFHNAKFDIAMLEYHFGFKFPHFDDTMLIHYVLDETPGTHGLKKLALRYTDYGDYEKPLYEWMDQFCKEHKIKKADFRWEWIPFDVMVPYASRDAGVTFLLYEFFMTYLSKNDRLLGVYKNILLPAVRFLVDVQDNGVPFNRQRLEWAQETFTEEIQVAFQKVLKHPEVQKFIEINGEFNPNSVPQLRRLLFDFVGLTPTGKKTEKGADSTDASVLEELAKIDEVPALILDVRKKSKIKNTYLDKILPQLDLDDKLRTNFNIHVTTSGRLSSSGKLNMQQLPRDEPIVKGCIMAKPGHKIVSIDLQTAEVYIAAVLSGDTNLQDVFRSGGNFHSTIAHKVFRLPCEVDEVAELYPAERQAAKAISFGILYGAGAGKIAWQVNTDGGSMTKGEAEEIINEYFRTFPKLKKWINSNNSFIKTNGFVYSALGRKRRLPNVKSDNSGIVGHEIRSGFNFLVQSVASDINLLGGIELNERIKSSKMKSSIFALVHDSILAEVPDDELEDYQALALACIQKDRGVSISDCPIKCDIDIHQDYSLGKFDKKYGDAFSSYLQTSA